MIKTADMNIPLNIRSKSEKRTLAHLEEQLNNFRENGSNIKLAKNFYNVIDECYFNIPIEQVSMVKPVMLYYLAILVLYIISCLY